MEGKNDNIVRLNIGGVIYITTKTSIMMEHNNLLSRLISGTLPSQTIDGAIFIDRDSTLFRHVLNYLRFPSIWRPPTDISIGELLKEADFYCLDGMKNTINSIIGTIEVKSLPEYSDRIENFEFRKNFPIVPLIVDKGPTSTNPKYSVYSIHHVHSKFPTVRRGEQLEPQDADNLLFANMGELHKIGYRLKISNNTGRRDIYLFETKDKSKKLSKRVL